MPDHEVTMKIGLADLHKDYYVTPYVYDISYHSTSLILTPD